MALSQTNLITFDFLVQRITEAKLPARCHLGVRFYLMDFPKVLLDLSPRSYQHPQLSCETTARSPGRSLQSSKEYEELSLSVSEARTFTVKRGKSCVFEMSPLALAASLKRSPLLVELLDLEGQSAYQPAVSSDVLGQGSVDLADFAQMFEQSSLSQPDCTGNALIEIANHSPRETIAVVHVKLRLALAASQVTREQHQLDHAANLSIPLPRSPRQCYSTAERGEKPNPLCEDVEPESSRVDRQLPSLLETQPAPLTCSNYACLRSADQQPSAHVAEFTCEQSQPEESEEKESVQYVPNTVCPPPLFYESHPRPPTETMRNCADKLTHEEVRKLESPDGDPAVCHWSALMAHDNNSHPISTHKLTTASDDPEFHSDTSSCHHYQAPPPHAPLPLLTALLEEFSRLRSYVESADRRTGVEQAVNMDKLSTAAQTEVPCSAPPVPAQRPGQRSPQPPSLKRANTKCSPANRLQTQHTHSRIFTRECCKAINPNAGRIPKNKSVIYPPDIASRRRQLNMRRKNMHHVRNLSQTSKKTDCHEPSASATVSSTGSCFDPGRRRLEVFIPQVPTATPVSTPLSGSCTSLVHRSPTAKATAGKSVGSGEEQCDVASQGRDKPPALRRQLALSRSISPECVVEAAIGSQSSPSSETVSSTEAQHAAPTLRVSGQSDESVCKPLQAVSELEADRTGCAEVSGQSALTVKRSFSLETLTESPGSLSQQAAAAAAVESSTDNVEHIHSGPSQHLPPSTAVVSQPPPAHEEASCARPRDSMQAGTHENTAATSPPKQSPRAPSPLPPLASTHANAMDMPPLSPGESGHDLYSVESYSDDFESATESA